MNKTAVRNFAIWARNKLIADITYKAGLLGISEKEIRAPLPQSTEDVQYFDIGMKDPYAVSGTELCQRGELAAVIRQKAEQTGYPSAYRAVVEEVAYTWFNRLIAVRFMEVNDYLPSRVRVLSSESAGKDEPDLVTAPFDSGLEFTEEEKGRILRLTRDNRLDELFRMLFIKQCNALNAVLPDLFEKTNGYTELLLNAAFTDKDGIVYRLVHDIAEEDFRDAVQIIGWMYQYYNEERKNEVISIYQGTVKKEDIPAATQLFTTDWVVRYLVDNSLGRYWMERHPQSRLKEKLEFFVAPKEGGIAPVSERIGPKELTFLDPCMGSGHMLVYAFDVLMEIYRECGYSDRDAAVCILQHNLYGLDIDDRACQLACFAVMMKARSYNRHILTMHLAPNLCAIQESDGIARFVCEGGTADSGQNEIGEYLIRQYRHAKEIGSLQTIDAKDYASFRDYLSNCREEGEPGIASVQRHAQLRLLMQKLAFQAEIMSGKYAVVCTNPPYMNKLEGSLKDFVTAEYKPYGGDLFSAFMYRNFGYCRKDGYCAFMTPFVWMFIRTYQNLRDCIIRNKSIATLVQMEYSAFEEATVPVCAFVLKNGKDGQNGIFIRLSEFRGGMEVQRQKVLAALADRECGYLYSADQDSFLKIPGMPIAYWVSADFIDTFEGRTVSGCAAVTNGMFTCDNQRFLRLWYEVGNHDTFFCCTSRQECEESTLKWYPYNKGGNFRRWYGNQEYVINFRAYGKEISDYRVESGQSASFPGQKYYFQESISWSLVSSSKFGVRYYPDGFVFDIAGSSVFPFDRDSTAYLLGLLAGKVSFYALGISNPTINYQAGDVRNLPVKFSKFEKPHIDALVKQNMILSKTDWDSFETSWNFTRHPLLSSTATVAQAFAEWKAFAEKQFHRLKSNEQDLNRIFLAVYGLQNELSPEVADRDVTVSRIFDSKEEIPESMKGSGYALTRRDVVKSFVSYAVGCMFGRYSPDTDGLVFAGGEFSVKYGEWSENPGAPYVEYNGKLYHRNHFAPSTPDPMMERAFSPDADNILLITDEEYFQDDITGRFTAFVKTVYGEETLEENLKFIADALGGKGNTSREAIRSYFLRNFYKDHCKTYQKRPIYWLFDSGKEDGFKALIYLHRYDENTVGNLRIDYLHRMQRVYESELARMREIIENSETAREAADAEKRREKLTKQLKEVRDYDEKIAHLALARITVDLDDGVKANYEKVQTGTDGRKLEVLAKI